jgi:hypothetical protein
LNAAEWPRELLHELKTRYDRRISVRQNRNLGKQKSSAVRCAPAHEYWWRLESGRPNNAGIGDEQIQTCGAKPEQKIAWEKTPSAWRREVKTVGTRRPGCGTNGGAPQKSKPAAAQILAHGERTELGKSMGRETRRRLLWGEQKKQRRRRLRVEVRAALREKARTKTVNPNENGTGPAATRTLSVRRSACVRTRTEAGGAALWDGRKPSTT